MSDLLINIRVGLYHLQLTRGLDIRISKNLYHRGYPNGFFAVYDFFGFGRG